MDLAHFLCPSLVSSGGPATPGPPLQSCSYGWAEHHGGARVKPWHKPTSLPPAPGLVVRSHTGSTVRLAFTHRAWHGGMLRRGDPRVLGGL